MITATKHLVLLPGLDGTGLLFQPFVEQCLEAEQVTIISYPDNYHIPYSELADFVASQLPKDKDIVLLGESYSGPVAIQLANRRELNISNLILVATFSYYPDSLLKSVSQWLPYKYLLKLPIPDFILKFVCFDKHVNSRIMGLLKTTLGLTPTAIMAKRMSEGVHIDVRDELKAISIPCTYIRAKHDKLVSRSASEEIKKINNSVDIIEIDGPHFILQTRILECYAVIKTIIK